MNANTVYRQVYKHFQNYEYKLLNQFVFEWESDFFCMSKSGYYNEVEVKVSRSDFFVDFKKPKHLLFKALAEKKEIMVRQSKYRREYGDIACELSIPNIFVRGMVAGETIKNGSEELIERDFKKGDYIVNDWRDRLTISNRRLKRIYWPNTSSEYIDLAEMRLPHRFWFAVPENLVYPYEVPGYAGLLYIGEGSLTVVKSAPYLHKRPVEMTAVLLKKYYNLWTYKTDRETKEKIFSELNNTP